VPKLYIETTIPSFYFNQRPEPEMVARGNWTRKWWDDHRHEYELVTSDAVLEELRNGDHPQREEKLALLRDVPVLPVTSEVADIAETYIKRFVMPNDPGGDAVHLALASYHACDVLLTWNCQHLANFRKLDHIRRVNVLLDLPVPALLTPLELLGESELL